MGGVHSTCTDRAVTVSTLSLGVAGTSVEREREFVCVNLKKQEREREFIFLTLKWVKSAAVDFEESIVSHTIVSLHCLMVGNLSR